jgi:hypothetical protein
MSAALQILRDLLKTRHLENISIASMRRHWMNSKETAMFAKASVKNIEGHDFSDTTSFRVTSRSSCAALYIQSSRGLVIILKRITNLPDHYTFIAVDRMKILHWIALSTSFHTESTADSDVRSLSIMHMFLSRQGVTGFTR